MLKKHLLFLLIMVSAVASAQIINFPDANFKTQLLLASTFNDVAQDINGNSIVVDTNTDGEIEVSEALTVYYLRVPDQAIADLTGIEYFTNLVYLDASQNLVASFDAQFFPALQELYVSENQLTTLDVSSLVNLATLFCEYNTLTSLDLSGASALQSLRARENALSVVATSDLSSLLGIDLRDNQISSLDFSNSPNLDQLFVGNNNLTTIDFSDLAFLTYVGVQGNQLTSIDLSGLPALEFFYCNTNLLTSLDLSQCPAINFLDISDNDIPTIDLSPLPMLESFTSEPGNLIALDVQHNYDLTNIDIVDNNLIQLFLKNGQTNTVDISLNPNLQFICVDEGSERQWIENQVINNGYTNCVVGSYCSFVPGGEYFTIQGDVSYDDDANGCDPSDPIIPYMFFNVVTGSTTNVFVGDSFGGYSIPVVQGSHTITPSFENPSYFNVSPSSITVSFPADPSPVVQDFCVTPTGNHPDLEVVIMPTTVARPGFEAEYKIIYSNKGNQTQSGALTLSYNNLLTDFISASPTYDDQTNTVFTWDYTDLEPFESREIDLIFEVNSPMDTPPVNNGDELGYASIIYPVSGDALPEDNAFELKQIVVGSEDPNDKRCLQGATVLPEFPGEYAHYVIRFENIGTFAAENIVITDNIDFQKFDIATLRVMSASHDFVTRISENDVEFIFEGINLPFDPANNDGYVLFKVRTLSNLEVGDTFSNRASIFFDYNFPILTNNYVTLIAEALGAADFEFDANFVIFPNPSKSLLNIHSNRDLEIESLEIYTSFGQLIALQMGPSEVIKIEKLATGVYFLKITTDQGRTFLEFIKE